MYYLLRYSSIFLPVGKRSYHQVSGHPLSKICRPRFCSRPSRTKTLNSSGNSSLPGKSCLTSDSYKSRKRKLLDNLRQQKLQKTRSGDDIQSGNVVSPISDLGKLASHDQSDAQKKLSKMYANEDQGSVSQNTGSLNYCSATGRKCSFPCLLLHVSQKVSLDYQIGKQIFYNKINPVSLFPPGHILNNIKPNIVGAVTLLKYIFGISDRCSDMTYCSCGGGRQNSHCKSVQMSFSQVERILNK